MSLFDLFDDRFDLNRDGKVDFLEERFAMEEMTSPIEDGYNNDYDDDDDDYDDFDDFDDFDDDDEDW